MKRGSAKVRLALGQVSLLISVLLLAMALGLVPDRDSAVVEGRARLCEALAVTGSYMVTHGNLEELESALGAVAERHGEVLSAAVRQQNGQLIVELGEHQANWGKNAQNSDVYVPIWAGNNRWGTLEVRFQPLGHSGFLGFLLSTEVKLIGFAAGLCFLVYVLYLSRMLQHLDPSKVVPRRVRSALDTLAEGLILFLDRNERIVLANKAFAEHLGTSPEQIQGRRASELDWIPCAADGENSAYPWLGTLKDRTFLKGGILGLRNGCERKLLVSSAPVLGDKDELRGALVSFEDITALEDQRTQLAQSKAAAEKANQAKSDFLARMSHDIRTPMNAILGFTDALRRDLVQDRAQRREYLNTIHSSGKHLLDLINDILDLSKIESGCMEIALSRISPHHLVQEVISILSVRAHEKKISLECEFDGLIPETILTDPGRLGQVLTNLVGNAVKFTDSGAVRVVVRLELGATDSLLIDVIDNGIGIAAEQLERVFDPFAQADTSVTRRYGGTGLGLAISRQFAEALGGTLTVESEVGKGSVFTLKVPTGSLESVRLIEAAQITEQRSESQPVDELLELPDTRILLVEDGATNRELALMVLEEAGAMVDTAVNGKIAVEKALQNSYDLILMDMQMPVMDGYTATKILREQGLDLPIVALTAHAMKDEEAKCRAVGCSGFLSKPFEFEDLTRTVHEQVQLCR